MRYYYKNITLREYCIKEDIDYHTTIYRICLLLKKEYPLNIAIEEAILYQRRIELENKKKLDIIESLNYSNIITESLLKLDIDELKLVVRRTYDRCEYEYLVPDYGLTISKVKQREMRILRKLKKDMKKK